MVDILIVSGVLLAVGTIMYMNRESVDEQTLNKLQSEQARYMDLRSRETNTKLQMYYELKINNLETQIKELERKTK